MHKLFAGHKKILLAVLVLAILIAGATAFWIIRESGRNDAATIENLPDYPPELSSAEVYNVQNEAGALYLAGKIDEAIAVIDKYVASDQSSNAEKVDALIAKAGMLSSKIEESLAVYDAAIAIQPNNPKPYAWKGNLYWNLGKIEEGKPFFEKALEVYDAGLPEDYNGPDRAYYAGLVEGQTGDGLVQMYR